MPKEQNKVDVKLWGSRLNSVGSRSPGWFENRIAVAVHVKGGSLFVRGFELGSEGAQIMLPEAVIEIEDKGGNVLFCGTFDALVEAMRLAASRITDLQADIKHK